MDKEKIKGSAENELDDMEIFRLLDDVIEHNLGMVLLLLKLNLEPVTHTRVAVGMAICRHRQI